MKIRPLGAEVFHADERTDRHDEANGRFSQFCEKRLIKMFSLSKKNFIDVINKGYEQNASNALSLSA